MAGYKPRYSYRLTPARPRRSIHDHSSRAPQRPSLASIEVVREILFTAFANMARRHSAVAKGNFSEKYAKAMDEYMVNWLTEVFSGHDNQFKLGPVDWHPHGLAQHLKGELAPLREGGADDFPDDDIKVLYMVFELFVDQSLLAVEDCIKSGYKVGTLEDLPYKVNHFIEVWAMLLTGIPIGAEVN